MHIAVITRSVVISVYSTVHLSYSLQTGTILSQLYHDLYSRHIQIVVVVVVIVVFLAEISLVMSKFQLWSQKLHIMSEQPDPPFRMLVKQYIQCCRRE